MQPIIAWVPNGIEWVVLLVIALLLLGHRLPSLARSLGLSISEFKKGTKEGEAELKKTEATNAAQPTTPPITQSTTTAPVVAPPATNTSTSTSERK